MRSFKFNANNNESLIMKVHYSLVILFIAASVLAGCKKDFTVSSDELYSPSLADVTANATLQELQDGRSVYIDNCGTCHGYYAPESYTPAHWKGTLTVMVPKTGMSSSDSLLVAKYVCKGKQ